MLVWQVIGHRSRRPFKRPARFIYISNSESIDLHLTTQNVSNQALKLLIMSIGHHVEDDQDDGVDRREQIISPDDILLEVPDGGEEPMDEDEVEELEAGSSSNVENNSVQIFTEHAGSVFTVAGHPTEPLAASGGEDDLGYIWDITDGEVIAKLTGHTDSITSVAWNFDGEMISTGGMDGKVRIWRRVGKEDYRNWEFLTELQGPDEVMVLLAMA